MILELAEPIKMAPSVLGNPGKHTVPETELRVLKITNSELRIL